MRNILLLIFLPCQLIAQTGSFKAFKSYPFPTELNTAARGAKMAWALDEQGRRNIYVAEAPDFKPRMLTNFSKDDGQELSSVTLSGDGSYVIFVRGGDHGANWGGEAPVNPGFDIQPAKVRIASIPFAGGPVKYISEGDDPVINPNGKEIAFIKGGQAWWSSIDSVNAAKNLFTTRGEVSSLQWSPDGKRLLFVTDRNDHTVIGIYTKGDSTLKWIAPSFFRDETPQWSPDGSKVAFVRMPGAGGAPDSLLTNHHRPWSIFIADTTGAPAKRLYKAPETLRGSFPTTHGQANLHWAAGNRIAFLSYQDGWPHLYSVDAGGGQPLLLTPGEFMCEHIVMSPDNRQLYFSANAGPDKLDIERRHAVRVSVDKADMQVLTPGSGLEWTPVGMGDGKTLALISATATRPPLPAVMDLASKNIRLLGQDRIPAEFPENKLVTPTQVIFRAADGMIVHADLFMPAGSGAIPGSAGNSAGAAAAGGSASSVRGAGTGRLPAIVFIHGGPPRQMLLGWHYSDYYSNAYASNQYLASLGFVVLSVNYRLGIGYGYEFHHPAHAGIWGASEYGDIKAAGEWLRKQGYVDSSRIGVYGGSYGGYLTAMALAHDSRLFAAGVDFHGVHDWMAQSGGIASLKDRYEKAPDLDKALKVAWESSPISAIKTWKSPVLVIQGDDDRNVRFSQSVDLISRLEQNHIPYESLMIVDDTHHWMHFENAVTVYGAAADYFVKKFLK